VVLVTVGAGTTFLMLKENFVKISLRHAVSVSVLVYLLFPKSTDINDLIYNAHSVQ